jgi:hypothetical protein
MVLVIRRDLRRDERGVASTVGTIMALLVFLTFLSLIVNQYVPVWMKDSEAAHMNSAVGQFADIKGGIDFQVLGALMAQNAQSIFVPSVSSNSVTLGVDGVPIFSSPTPGALSSYPDAGPWAVSFQYCIQVGNVCTYQNVLQTSSGQIDLSVANRYYPAGDVVYENGAVIRSQPDGQVVRASPVFEVSQATSNLSIAFELVSLYNAGSTAGTGVQVVDTKVIGVNQQSYTGLSKDLYINHTSSFGLAWFNFLNTTLSSSLKLGPGDVTYSSAAGATLVKARLPGTATEIYWLKMIFDPVTGLYSLSLRIIVTPSLSMGFTLQQAYVNVGVGPTSNVG